MTESDHDSEGESERLTDRSTIQAAPMDAAPELLVPTDAEREAA